MLKRLNWFGFSIVFLCSMMAATANNSVTNFQQWLFLVVVFGLPASIFFLIVGREEKSDE